MAVFFTSDTHFGHAAIIDLCKRPFASADEMDAVMIARWNETVGPGDTVYHLGDMFYRGARCASDYLRHLNGEVHLIAGNHDTATVAHHAALFASISQISEITVDGHSIVLCHYPMREWNGAWRGAWHLYGHTHGRMDSEPYGYSLDVCVDTHEYRPWSMPEIEAALSGRANPFAKSRRKHNSAKTATPASLQPGNP